MLASEEADDEAEYEIGEADVVIVELAAADFH